MPERDWGKLRRNSSSDPAIRVSSPSVLTTCSDIGSVSRTITSRNAMEMVRPAATEIDWTSIA